MNSYISGKTLQTPRFFRTRLWWPAWLSSTVSEQRFYWYLNSSAYAKLNSAFVSSTYCILLFQDITLSKSLIHQQHKMYAKGLEKNAACKQHKLLEYQKGWSFCGHFGVIRYSFESRIFYTLALRGLEELFFQLSVFGSGGK